MKNTKLKRLHERCSRFIYNDKQSLFPELLQMDGSAFFRMRNFQSPATEMFCDNRDLSPPIISNIFTRMDNIWYNLRQISKLSRLLVKYVLCKALLCKFALRI